MRMNAFEESYELVKLDDKYCLFTNMRLDRTTVPKGLHCYDVRDSDDLDGSFAEICPSVLVNHWGTILCKDPFPLNEFGGYYPQATEQFLDKSLTLSTFLHIHREDMAECFEDPEWQDDLDAGKEATADYRNSFYYASSFGDITVYPRLSMYRDSDNLYVGMDYYDAEQGVLDFYGDVTVNISELPYLHSTIDTNNNGNRILDFLEDKGFGQRTGEFLPSGYCRFPVFRFNEEMIQKLDPQVLEDHAKARGKAIQAQSLADKIRSAESQSLTSSQNKEQGRTDR